MLCTARPHNVPTQYQRSCAACAKRPQGLHVGASRCPCVAAHCLRRSDGATAQSQAALVHVLGKPAQGVGQIHVRSLAWRQGAAAAHLLYAAFHECRHQKVQARARVKGIQCRCRSAVHRSLCCASTVPARTFGSNVQRVRSPRAFIKLECPRGGQGACSAETIDESSCHHVEFTHRLPQWLPHALFDIRYATGTCLHASPSRRRLPVHDDRACQRPDDGAPVCVDAQVLHERPDNVARLHALPAHNRSPVWHEDA